MEASVYFDQVVNEAADINLSEPILYQLERFTSAQLHFFFSQIYYFVNLFPGYAGALVWRTNNEILRFALIENMIDECGGFEKISNRDYSATHSGILKEFIEKLDATHHKLASKNIHTEIMINDFNKLFINSTFIEALGAMASMECMSTKWFELVYKQLIDRNEFSKEELYFFDLHTVVDVVHGNILKEVLLPLLTSTESYALFKNGAMTAALIWKNFYHAISQSSLMNSIK